MRKFAQCQRLIGASQQEAGAEITAMVAGLKLPAIYSWSWRQWAEVGGLMVYGPSLIKAMGLIVSEPFLLLADEVIE